VERGRGEGGGGGGGDSWNSGAAFNQITHRNLMAGEVAGSGDSPDPDPLQDSFFFFKDIANSFFFLCFPFAF